MSSQTEATPPVRQIPFGRPFIGPEERQAVLDVLDGPILVHGPRSHDFERSFGAWTGAPEAVSVSSCTAGLHLVWFGMGLGPGDEVIVPAQTHTATAHAVELTGARPVFVDAEPVTGNIDIEAIEGAITDRTRGISIVHYLGEPVDMPRVMAIADRHGLFVLEDCALAIGATIDGIHVGLLGDAGAFSFYPVKHLTTAEGGMVITRHADVAAKLVRQRAFGVDRTPSERSVPGVYDVTQLGFNYRMNELQAAIGIEQMKRIDGFLEARRRNFQALASALADIDGLRVLPASDGERRSSHYCLSAVLDDGLAKRRPEIVQHLTAQGVGTSVYYPRPVPLFSYYQERYGHLPEDFPVASTLSSCSIALPVGPHLDVEDMAYVGAALRSAIEKER